MKNVIKSTGQTEAYESEKLYTSIYASCLGVHEPKNAAEVTAKKVVKDMDTWLGKQSEVTTADIRKMAGKYLSEINNHAGYLYLHHHIMW